MSTGMCRHDAERDEPSRYDAVGLELRDAPGTGVGFRSRTKVDESPQALELARRAVERAKQGDDDAMRYLYTRYSHNVYGYVRSIVRDDYEAEDVTQHVFAKLMTSIVKYDDRGVPFFAWLLRMARNVAIDHLRSLRAIPVDEVLSSDEAFEDGLDDVFAIRGALSTLPEEQRKVVFLRHVVGLSPGEIAEMMGKTEGSIHGLHHRGRRSLRDELSRLALEPTATARRDQSARALSAA